MTPGLMFTGMVTNALQKAVYEEAQSGCVGPMFGNASIRQRVHEVHTAEEALAYRGKTGVYEVMGLYYKAIYMKYAILQEVGKFEDRLKDMEQTMEDYMLRMIQKGWKSYVVENALMFLFSNSNKAYIKLKGTSYLSMEQKRGMHYFNFIGNGNFLSFIDKDSGEKFSVLEVGCDCGATSVEEQNFDYIIFGDVLEHLRDPEAVILYCKKC